MEELPNTKKLRQLFLFFIKKHLEIHIFLLFLSRIYRHSLFDLQLIVFKSIYHFNRSYYKSSIYDLFNKQKTESYTTKF